MEGVRVLRAAPRPLAEERQEEAGPAVAGDESPEAAKPTVDSLTAQQERDVLRRTMGSKAWRGQSCSPVLVEASLPACTAYPSNTWPPALQHEGPVPLNTARLPGWAEALWVLLCQALLAKFLSPGLVWSVHSLSPPAGLGTRGQERSG